MKRATLLAMMSVAFSSSAQQIITTNPSATPRPPLTTESVNPAFVRAACYDAVQREASSTEEIRVQSVADTRGDTDTVAACIVRAQVSASAERLKSTGANITTDVQYSVSLDLLTGKAEVERIDEVSARRVALTALAAKLIEVTPTAISSDEMTFTATVSGQNCIVQVTTRRSEEPKRWHVKNLDCQR